MFKRFFTASRAIAVSFALLILCGAGLLMLPISSISRRFTPFVDALFTAASASCVTGLSVYDTLSYWSVFGKCVILALIQIGGIGCMTVVALIVRKISGKFSMREEGMLMQAVGVINRRDVLSLLQKVVTFTLVAESIGALALCIRWSFSLGFPRALGTALFTSISAFCNAGFDLFGDLGGGSLTYFGADPWTLGIISALIITGGLGFLVWNDLIQCRGRWKKLQFHTKAVLLVTLSLLTLGTAFFYISERNGAFSGMSTPRTILSSFFQSVTTRTAGFYAFEQSSLSAAGVVGSLLLMCIGGSPGSTAGGLKTTTLLVVLLSELATARRKPEITLFRRRIDEDTVRQANALVVIYLSLILLATVLICTVDTAFSFEAIVFEVTSAVATVGLSLGITAELAAISKIVLILLMYIGRIGGLTFVYMLSEKHYHTPISRPVGEILIG